MKKAVVILAVMFVFSLLIVPSASAGGGDPKAEFIGHWRGEQGPAGRPGRMLDIILSLDNGRLVVKEYKKGAVQAGPMSRDMKPVEYEKGATADAAWEGNTAVLTITFKSGSKAHFQKVGGKLERVKSDIKGTYNKVGN